MPVSGCRIAALYSLHYFLIPIAIFFYVFDASILNVQCIGWILKEDLGQHFIGWHAFRYDAWRWPIAWSNLLLAPAGITISITDNNPLVSIILEHFRVVWAHGF